MSKAKVHMDFIKWLGMSESGCRTGMVRIITNSRRNEILKDRNRDNSKCYAVDPGPTCRSIFSPMEDSSSRQKHAIAIRASAAPNHNRLLKTVTLSPAQPRRAETCPGPGVILASSTFSTYPEGPPP